MEMQLHNVTIEKLQIQDIDWFIENVVTRMLVDELKRPELVDEGSMLKLTCQSIDSGGAFIAVKDGIKVGGLGSVLVPHIFNPAYSVLVELAWYVLPEHRNSRAGIMLIDAFAEYAETVADESTLSLLASSQVNHKTLERRGYSPNEVGFLKKHRKP